MEKLSIGQLAKMNNVSTQALRMYDKMGLLEPYYVDGDNRYRYYDIRQSACLDMIQYMKSLGIPLKEIRDLLDEQNIDVITSILNVRLEENERMIEQLRVTQNAIRQMISRLDNYKSVPAQGQIIEEEIEERSVHCYYSPTNFYTGPETFEAALREMKKSMLSMSLPISYFCNVGSIIASEHIERCELIAQKIFIMADEYSAKILPVEKIPGGRYLCVYFENFRNEYGYAKMLLEEVRRRNWRIAGDYLCETIAEFPVFKKAERNTFIKIQLPVSFF